MSRSLRQRERVQGGFWGLLVGDALGVPYEFHAPHTLPAFGAIEFEPPPGFDRSHRRTPAGTWSDDGAHALCLTASLLSRGRLDTDDLIGRLVDWHETGYLAVDGRVFDVGIQTAASLRSYREGIPALECGGTHEQANGNGSLMRILPLALWHRGTDEQLVEDARMSSRVTHGHARAELCCALYCLWARRTLQGAPSPWDDALASLRGILGVDTYLRDELETHIIGPDATVECTGSGYVVDCLRSAEVAVRERTFERALRTAVAFGHDTDTTACVTGGIAGLKWGLSAIPSRWIGGLRGRALAEPLLEALLARPPLQAR